jgi:hypothetical protein
MRKYLRQMAKARLKAMGIERVNRHMTDFWRRAINDPDAEKALMAQGQKIKAQKGRKTA